MSLARPEKFAVIFVAMADEKPNKPTRPSKQQREEETKKIAQEYADDQRAILENIRRKMH